MLKKILAIVIITFLMSFTCWAEGPSYQPGSSCDYSNITLGTGAATEVRAYDGTAVDTRITIETTGSAPARCSFGNVYGSTPNKPTTSNGYEISTTVPMDYYPYVTPTADTWCIAETGTPHLSILTCHK